MRTTYCGLVSETLMGQTVTLMGWAHRRRDHGGVIFIDLRDREGLVQVVCDPDRAATFATAEGVRNEYCLRVTGLVRARPAGTDNGNLTSGKVEVLCHELEVLNPSVSPPFQIDDENLSETTRLTHRVLDLRRPTMQRNLMLRYRVAMEVRKFLDANGFIDIETPMLTKSTPEGARDYLVPSRVHDGMFFALPQSPQLFKQLLMVAGFDRYYQITKCFRDEDLRADRQPEFTQIDIETSFLGEEEIRAITEAMIRTVFRKTLGVELPVYAELDDARDVEPERVDLVTIEPDRRPGHEDLGRPARRRLDRLVAADPGASRAPLSGDLAFVSQSGALITAVVDWAAGRGIGFSQVVSLGEMADVDLGDMLDHLATDRSTRAVLLYVEAVTHAPKFLSAARRAARLKPVIVVKSGRHAGGAHAARIPRWGGRASETGR